MFWCNERDTCRYFGKDVFNSLEGKVPVGLVVGDTFAVRGEVCSERVMWLALLRVHVAQKPLALGIGGGGGL
jgi:hypothetical protein